MPTQPHNPSEAALPLDKEKRTAILDQAHKLFMRFGVKSMTMDDVATHLRMSKKTLYEHFTDKNDLVEQVVAGVCEHHRAHIDAICQRGLNAIDENHEITTFIVGQIGGVHPSVQFDLQKYHPKAWGILEHSEQTDIHRCVTGNLLKGIKEGLYRDGLDVEVITRLYIARIDATWDGRVFPPEQFNIKDVLWEHFAYHIRGIASEKGVKYLEKKTKKERS
jgi:TetR/AcrR family transcriptional regulator, cholesterol catabolism regulator